MDRKKTQLKQAIREPNVHNLVYINYEKTFIICLLLLAHLLTFSQNKSIEHPSKAIYNILSKKNLNNNIEANDSLTFKIFPDYKQLYTVDYSLFMRGRNHIRLIIPILIYDEFSEKKIYKDNNGNTLIQKNLYCI